MDVQIQQHNENISTLSRKSIRERVAKVLQRYSHRLQRTTLIFKDVNGSKGGVDKQCTVQARLASGGEIVVTKSGSSITQALFRALRGLRNLIVRKAARERQLRYGFINKYQMTGK